MDEPPVPAGLIPAGLQAPVPAAAGAPQAVHGWTVNAPGPIAGPLPATLMTAVRAFVRNGWGAEFAAPAAAGAPPRLTFLPRVPIAGPLPETLTDALMAFFEAGWAVRPPAARPAHVDYPFPDVVAGVTDSSLVPLHAVYVDNYYESYLPLHLKPPWLEFSAELRTGTLAPAVGELIVGPPSSGGGEAGLHGRNDKLCVALDALGLLQSRRDAADLSTSSGGGASPKRSDKTYLYEGVPVAKIEEKRGDRDITIAQRELTEKLAPHSVAVYGAMPWFLGAAIASSHATLHHISARDGRMVAERYAAFNLDNVGDRLAMFGAILQYATLLRAWVRFGWCHSTVAASLEWTDTPSGSRLKICRTGEVCKEYAKVLPHLAALAAKNLNVPTLERLCRVVESRGRTTTFALPVCSPRPAVFDPTALIRDVREALDALHAAGFAHLDVRLDNVLFDHTVGRFVLVDLEFATPLGATWPTPHPRLRRPDATAEVAVEDDNHLLALLAGELGVRL